MSLADFIEEKINAYAQKIVTHKDKMDDLAFGELSFYMAARRVIGGNATTQDLGMMDAINDTLEQLGVIEKGRRFYE